MTVDGWRQWPESHRGDAEVARLEKPAGEVLSRALIRDGDRVLDVGTGLGLLAGAEAAATPTGAVVGIDRSAEAVAACVGRHSGAVAGTVGDAEACRSPPPASMW